MSVEVINMQGGRGNASNALRFTDTLIAPDQPFGVGNDWINGFLMSDITTVGNDYSGGINRGATGLTYQNALGAGFLPRGRAYPFPFNLGVVRTRRQFVEFKVISNPGGVGRLMGLCYSTQNSISEYQMLMVTEVSQLAVNRINGGVTTNLLVQGAATAYVNNDVIRMECDPITTPGTTIIKLFKNGVQIGATVNDNAGGRLTNGLVGLGFDGANPGVAITISNFNGGAL